MPGHDTDFLHYEVPASKLWRETFICCYENGKGVKKAGDEADEAVARYRAAFNQPQDEDKDW